MHGAIQNEMFLKTILYALSPPDPITTSFVLSSSFSTLSLCPWQSQWQRVSTVIVVVMHGIGQWRQKVLMNTGGGGGCRVVVEGVKQ